MQSCSRRSMVLARAASFAWEMFEYLSMEDVVISLSKVNGITAAWIRTEARWPRRRTAASRRTCWRWIGWSQCETKDAHRTSERRGRRLTKSMTNGVQAASQLYQGHAEYIVEDRHVTTADSRSIRELSTSIVKIGCPATGRIRSMLSAKTDSLSEVA
jgi:hypothetical protein